jgi:hypothetical protein
MACARSSQWQCVGVSSQVSVGDGEVGQPVTGLWVVGSQGRFVDGQRGLPQSKGLRVVPCECRNSAISPCTRPRVRGCWPGRKWRPSAWACGTRTRSSGHPPMSPKAVTSDASSSAALEPVRSIKRRADS